MLSLLFFKNYRSVLRLVIPPNVSVNLVAVQINMEPLSRQNRNAIGVEVEAIYLESERMSKNSSLPHVDGVLFNVIPLCFHTPLPIGALPAVH